MNTDLYPLVSIIVPAKNEAKLLPQCLLSLTQQRTKVDYEIIVVDTNSEDDTPKIAQSFGARVINEPKPGKVHAFRLGAKEAQGDILCFAEADCKLPDHWIQTITDYFEQHHDVVAISGSYTFHSSTPFYNFLAVIVDPIARWVYYLLYGSIPIRGSNFAIRRSAYQSVGGFPDNYFELYDVELGRRVAQIGSVHHVPSLEIKTSDRRFRGRIMQFLSEFFPSFVRNILLQRPIPSQKYEDIR